MNNESQYPRKLSRTTIIPNAIGYVVNETKEGTEIIIDDASGDKTTILLRDYKAKTTNLDGGSYYDL